MTDEIQAAAYWVGMGYIVLKPMFPIQQSEQARETDCGEAAFVVIFKIISRIASLAIWHWLILQHLPSYL